MPYGKRKYSRKNNKRRPKRNLRRARRGARLGRPSRGITPSVYFFKRSITEIVELNTQTPPDGWLVSGNSLYKQFQYSLRDLNDYGDFTSLFNQYKICGVKMTFFFTQTNTGPIQHSDTPPHAVNSNSQIIMFIGPNGVGASETLDRDYFMDSQAVKRRLCLNGGRPISVYRRMRQLSNIYQSVTGTDYAMARPRWISTVETSTPHYGMNCMLERVDGEVFANDAVNYQKMRVEATYYVACRQVQ